MRESWVNSHLDSPDEELRQVGVRYNTSKALLTKDLGEHWPYMSEEEQRPFCQAWKAQRTRAVRAAHTMKKWATAAGYSKAKRGGGRGFGEAEQEGISAGERTQFALEKMARELGHNDNKKTPLSVVKVSPPRPAPHCRRLSTRCPSGRHFSPPLRSSLPFPSPPFLALPRFPSRFTHGRATAASAAMSGACSTASTAGGRRSSASNRT